MQTVPYCHINLSTAHSPHNLSHLPISPNILSSTHLPTLSHHLSGRPVYLQSSPLVYPAYAHHSTNKSICQPVFFTTHHLPNLNITCSVYPSTCNHPYAKYFYFTCTLPLNRQIHSSSAHSDPLTCRPVNQSSYPPQIRALSTQALHIFFPVYLSNSLPIHH